MAKDPAVLFYTSDFYVGTATMTDEQCGKYIRLLCLQHQKGRLTEQDMLSICKTYDEHVFSKFKQDNEGLYFNARMEKETNLRRAYSESRKRNASKQTDTEHMQSMCKPYAEHMENENEDININTVVDKDKKKESRHKYGQYGWVLLTDAQYDKLLHDLGEDELKLCIKIVDEYTQSTGNKQHYKDWNLVIRKCSRDNWKNHKGGENGGTSKGTSSFRPSTGFKKA